MFSVHNICVDPFQNLKFCSFEMCGRFWNHLNDSIWCLGHNFISVLKCSSLKCTKYSICLNVQYYNSCQLLPSVL